ncbi:MAG: ankyrin repeat domain-containing protein [Deltaproteobacteria bacterium]|nr:ankyrin repeat domain-containing protein [Deltaproteobacteria bacterium]
MGDINQALRDAAEKGDLAGIRAAIAGGADRNAWPAGADSALCYAAMYDHVDAVKLLVEAGADVSHPGSYGRRPLHYAKRPEIAAYLIDHGADLAVRHDGGHDALHDLMTRFDNEAVAAVLLDRGLPVIRYATAPPSIHTVVSHLQWAVHCKRPKCVRLLLTSGGDPNEFATNGGPVIFQALGPPPAGNEIARMLIEAGARVDSVDFVDCPLLPQLCDRRDPELVAVALAHGGRVDSEAMQRAARVGDLEVLTILLEHPTAQIDAVNTYGVTALMTAAHAGRDAAVEMLLRCGATPTLRDRDGETALHRAADGRSLAVVHRLLAAGCRLEEETEAGWTPLEYAARSDAYAIVEDLLARGVDLDHRTRDGKTPLMIASAAGAPIVHSLLEKHGADRSLVDAEGKTAADYALARAKQEEEKERERAERFY